MPAVLLTNEEFNTLLTDFIVGYSAFSFSADYALFLTLFDHGFRIRELENLQDWVINESDQIIAPTSKGGNDRLIDVAEVHPRVITSISEEENFVFISSYDYYKNAFQRRIGLVDLTTNQKSLSTHSFRHNRIKQLSDGGATVEEIKTITGIVEDATVTGYINSQVYAHYL